MGLSQPVLRAAECLLTSGWLGVNWSTFSAAVLPERIAGWFLESNLSSSDRARPGPEHRYVFPEPRRASALVYHQVSRVFRLILQRVHRHVRVVWHLCSH